MDKGQAVFRTYTTLARCIAALPEPVALGLGNVVGEVLFRVRHEQRTQVAANLARVLGAGADDAVVLDLWARRSFREYARYWVEGARLPDIDPEEVARHVVVDGLHHLHDGVATGKGCILALPHIGSWEYGGAFLATQGLPMTAVAERIEPPELFDYFVGQRAAMGLNIVPLDRHSGGTLLAALRAGKLVGLLCDRDIEGTGIEVEFFGERTTMPAGPATLALRTGATLCTGAVYSGPGRDHRALVDPPLDTTRTASLRADVARVTQEIATRLEVLIRRAPEQWHVFQPLWLSDRPEQEDAREVRRDPAPATGAVA
ncbi:MAG TPA: phosphatidylinositol mannoside acyltransferase [Acidimicrobiales bacterium]|nr:phosphatidylinositol mannoside acyltransferase [Acidimicrobiales bacterium]